MSPLKIKPQQQGMALVVSLLFLLVLTMISVVAATNSRSALQMAMNTQDELQSFQAAEAGIYAALATYDTPRNLFGTRTTTEDVFSGLSDEENPLRLLETGADSVKTDVIYTSTTPCDRKADGTSCRAIYFEYYRIESEHAVEKRARTKVNAGMFVTVAVP